MMDSEWRPRRSDAALTPLEINQLRMTPRVMYHDMVKIHNSKITFHTESSQAALGRKHNDTVVKTWYRDSNDRELVAYGIIQRIFTHSMFQGGPTDVLIECNWFENIPEEEQAGNTWLPQVRKNPDLAFNVSKRYTFLRQCAGYNIMVAPHDPWEPECNVYDVIDRWRTYQDHSKHS